MRSLLSTAFLCLLLIACGTETDNSVSTEAPEAEAASFGSEFTPDNVLPAESLTSSYTQEDLRDSVRTTITGTVQEVCQAKGCWMTIDAGAGELMTVNFKDYGFFVPKDISGREVTMQGVAFSQMTPVDELRHYAADAGQPQSEIDAITEPKRELRFLADGVIVAPGS